MKPGLCPDMPVLVNDWLSSGSITLMSPAEEGAYFRLLCYAWNDPNCTLPDDDSDLAGLSRLGEAWEMGSGAKIRACFTADLERPGRIYNAKQRSLREQQEQRLSSAKEKATKAANTRWRKGEKAGCSSNAQAVHEDMLGDASSLVPRPSSRNVPPIVPQGDTEGKKSVWTPGPIQQRLNKLFRRRDSTRWSDKEQRAFRSISPIPDEDMALIERYYTATPTPGKDYRRRDLCTLLNNWPGELDRARNFKPQKMF